MPNKTIYVSDGDVALFARAQELSGGNLSATITCALRRFVDAEDGCREGYEPITVRVGPGLGRRVRFTGVLLGEWKTSRVYRSQKGTFVLHTEGEPALGIYNCGDDLRANAPEDLYDLIASALNQPPIEQLDI